MDVKLIPEADMPSVEREVLRSKLDKFYGTASGYLAFASASHQVDCWVHIENEIQKGLTENNDSLSRVLEIGAGKSGFGDWLHGKGLREKVLWTAQDITTINESWLNSRADDVVYGDVNEIPGLNRYDIVFSTYVLEHVTNPQQHLDFLFSLLAKEGKLFIFCPRYDMPGYICPSCLHLNLRTRFLLATKLVLLRLRSLLMRQPAFLIQTDLAAFHRPFFLDADAVHWASLLDLKLWAKRKGGKVRILKVGKPKVGSKDWLVKWLLTCAIEIQK